MAKQKSLTDQVDETPEFLKAKASKVSKMKKSILSKASRKPPIKVIEEPQHTDVVKKNGLADLENVPEHLVEVFKRNAEESPLLRLPGEIRNMIWKFALSGQFFRIHDDRVTIYEGILASPYSCIHRYPIASFRPGDHRSHNFALCIPKYFRHMVQSYIRELSQLSEVCRQVRYETTAFMHARNITIMNSHALNVLGSAQCDAITDIAMHHEAIDIYLEEGVTFKDRFPNVQRVHLNEQSVDVLGMSIYFSTKDYQETYRQQVKNWWQLCVHEKEGQDVEVLFNE